MKLTFIIVLLGCLQVSAHVDGQNMFTLSMDHVRINKVLNKIQKESSYRFFYNERYLKHLNSVSVNVKKATLAEVMEQLLDGSLSYKVIDKNLVVISPNGELDQQHSIQGTVTDENGTPLVGVTIKVKGTSQGTVTDAEGNFALVVPDNATLEVSYIGYETQDITVGNQTNLTIRMKPSATGLNQLVVIGYGTQKKGNLTGAISSISQADFNGGITTSPALLLQGKLAGVQVLPRSGDPNSAPVVHIRGVGSIRSGSQPLYVLDGVPLSGNAQFLDPQDIKSFDVLKGASATAIYGSRAANGVIEITTKKGQGAPTLTYNGFVSISSPGHVIDLLSAQQYRNFQQEYGDPSKIFSNTINTDWLDQILRTSVSQSHVLSYAGGSDNTTYRAAAYYKNIQGIVNKSQRKKYGGNISLGQSFLNDRIHVDMKLHGIFIRANNSGINNDAGVSGNLLSLATIANPTYPAYDKNGDIFDFPDGINPLMVQKRTTKFDNETNILGYIRANVRIIKGLRYSIRFNASKFNVDGVMQRNPISLARGTADIPDVQGRLNTNIVDNSDFGLEQHLEYRFNIKQSSFVALAGYSYQKFLSQTRAWSINNFSTTEINAYRNPSIGTDLTINQNRPSGSASENKLQSFFGRVNYNYNDKYLLKASVRADGSSKFGQDRRYGVFPSFSIAWRLSNEPFFSGFTALSHLKLRVGWGQTGSQNIPANITRQLLSVGTGFGQGYYFEGTNIPGITFIRAQNKDLHWETSTQSDIGLDFGFLDNRISGTIDVYNKVSSDILFKSSVSPDPIQPTSVFWKNYGSMKIRNKGLELDLDYMQPIGSDFSFNVGGNISFMHNEVTGSPIQIPIDPISGQGLSGVTVGAILNHQPIGTFYLKKWMGIDKNGLSMYKDVNSDSVINAADFVAAGHALPNVMYGAHIGFKYKNLNLVLNFNGVSGNKIYWNDENAYYAFARLAGGFNSLRSVAKFGGRESIKNSPEPSTRFLYNGSYFRLNNATISYSILPGPGNDWLKKINLYITGQNIFVITDYPGYDPAIDTPRSTDGFEGFGVDGTSYPKARTFILGIIISI